MKWINGKKSIFKYQELASKLILPFWISVRPGWCRTSVFTSINGASDLLNIFQEEKFDPSYISWESSERSLEFIASHFFPSWHPPSAVTAWAIWLWGWRAPVKCLPLGRVTEFHATDTEVQPFCVCGGDSNTYTVNRKTKLGWWPNCLSPIFISACSLWKCNRPSCWEEVLLLDAIQV